MTKANVTHLFIKKNKGQGVTPQKELSLKEKFGIEKDINASSINPRHVLITSKQTLDEFQIKPGQLRENIVVENFHVDELKSGESIKIGEAHLRVLFHCEPCGFVETIRRGLLKEIEYKRGILAYVKKSGNIKIGDNIIKTHETYEEIPYKIFDRFIWTLKKVPKGKVVTYQSLIEGLGLPKQFYRVIPAYIKRVENLDLPTHRVVDSNLNLIPKYIPDHQKLLERENVNIEDTRISDEKYIFDIRELY